MGIIDKASDSLIKKIAKKETIRVTYEELANMTDKLFLSDADSAFAKKVVKTAKGGCPVTQKSLKSKSGRYTLFVGNSKWLFGKSKQTYIYDETERKFYELNKDRYWKKFYKAVLCAASKREFN